jgi:predicted ATPase/DNA-binding XRE family transcriptional regulator
MASSSTISFGDLLRQHRLAAGLSQAQLADLAGLSMRGISDLERGVKTRPRRDTILRLTQALQLGPTEREALVDALRLSGAAVRDGRSKRTGREASPPTDRRGALPHQLTSFVGRERQIEDLSTRLATTRLLTLTGAGGCGKTRLALEVATRTRAAFPDGVWFVDLAPLANADLVPAAVASVLGVQSNLNVPLVTALSAYLRDQTILLILDNCEHLIDACAHLVDALLRACPKVAILATSREALRIAGEIPWRVPSLTVPDLDTRTGRDTIAAVTKAEAGRLFVERAMVLVPSFAVTEQNAQTIAQICARLEGIPLAIELAVARVTLLSVEQIASRLDRQFQLLTGGSRTAPLRHQTLRATIDWDYDLLSEPEKALFRRLGVFASGCTVEAAESICTVGAESGVTVLDGLESLRAKSLVHTDNTMSEPRLTMLETIRAFALEKLDLAGERQQLEDLHLAYYSTLAGRAHEASGTAEFQGWLKRLWADANNFRAARERSRKKEATIELQLVGTLRLYWISMGFSAEIRAWLEAAFARRSQATATAQALTLTGLGEALLHNGEFEQAMTYLRDCRSISGQIGDLEGVARAEHYLGYAARTMGDLEKAQQYQEAALQYYRTADKPKHLFWVLLMLTDVFSDQANFDRALDYLEQATTLGQLSGDQDSIAWATMLRGRIELYQGREDAAIPQLDEARSIFQNLGDRFGLGEVLTDLGDAYAQRLGGKALSYYHESLPLLQEAGDMKYLANCLEGVAAVAGTLDQPERGARLFAAAERFRQERSMPSAPAFQAVYRKRVDATRDRLNWEVFHEAWAAGRRMTIDQAIAEARKVVVPTSTRRASTTLHIVALH